MKFKKSFFLIAALVLSLSPIFNITPVSAVANTGFKAGYIMSNEVMANYNSMSLAQIQAFLKSKNPCNDTNIYRASYYPWVTYHTKDGHFVCMADDTFNGKSAARIIYDAAQTYKINPQVLIVLLQKEQGLVTDTWPNSQQYRSATGYGCPDTAACDARYYGFENQLMRAAELFRTVLDGGWSNYPAGKYNYIKYNPNSACGGSSVYIRNRATSALYRYTPYQPNAATLAAGWGTAACGAYGNRNFYLYFTAWFGNPVATGSEVISNAANAKDFAGTYYDSKASSGKTSASTSSNSSSSNAGKSSTSTQTTVKIPASTIYLPDGVYALKTDGGLALTVSGSTATLQADQSTQAQEFTITRGTDGYYTLASRSPKRYLSASTSKTTGTKLNLTTKISSCAEKWSLLFEHSHYVFRSTCTAYSLGFTADTTGAAAVTYRHKDGEATQQWNLVAKYKSNLTETDGRYSLVTARGKALAVENDSVAFGANLQLGDKNDSAAQEFQLTRGADGFYTITNPRAGKAIAVASSGNNVHLVQVSTNSCAQKWFVEVYYAHYLFRSACNGAALSVAGAQLATTGVNVESATLTRQDHQLWQLAEPNQSKLLSGTYKIVTPSLKALDFNPSLSTNIYVVKSGKNKTQEFKITRTSDGYFQLINPQTNQALAVASTNFGANVQLAQPANTCTQKWFFTSYMGYYAIRSACSRAALNVTGSAVGANVNATEFNRQPLQKWKVAKF